MENNNGKSLFERLGGESGIASIVDKLVEAHMNNPEIGTRYLAMREDPERRERVKKDSRRFFYSGTGDPETFEKKVMPENNRGMNIRKAVFLLVLDDIVNTLDKNNVDPASKTNSRSSKLH